MGSHLAIPETGIQIQGLQERHRWSWYHGRYVPVDDTAKQESMSLEGPESTEDPADRLCLLPCGGLSLLWRQHTRSLDFWKGIYLLTIHQLQSRCRVPRRRGRSQWVSLRCLRTRLLTSICGRHQLSGQLG